MQMHIIVTATTKDKKHKGHQKLKPSKDFYSAALLDKMISFNAAAVQTQVTLPSESG